MKAGTKGFSIKKCAGCFVLALMAAAPAFAAESGHHAEPVFTDIIPYWVNFVLYVLLLVWLLKAPVSSGWEARKENIRVSVHRGRTEREAAESALREAEGAEAAVAASIKALTDQIAREAASEAAEIVREAKEKAARTKQQGADMLAAEEKAFESALKKELAEAVVRKATERLMRDMNVEKDAPLRASALRALGNLVH